MQLKYLLFCCVRSWQVLAAVDKSLFNKEDIGQKDQFLSPCRKGHHSSPNPASSSNQVGHILKRRWNQQNKIKAPIPHVQAYKAWKRYHIHSPFCSTSAMWFPPTTRADAGWAVIHSTAPRVRISRSPARIVADRSSRSWVEISLQHV